MKNLDKGYHCVYDLNYHLILVTKYRRNVITDAISNDLRNIFTKTGMCYGIDVKEFSHDTDHVHVLFTGKPTTKIPKFPNVYKSQTSRLIKQQYPEVRNKLWEEKFWSRSYFLATTGGVTLDVLKRYIQSQGEKK